MAFTSPIFIAFILVVVLLTQALPSPAGRSGVLLLASLVFIGSHVDSIGQVGPLAAFLLLCYVAIEGVRRSRTAASLWMGGVAVIASFVVLKKFSFLDESLLLPFPYLVIGLSYVLFRVLHLMIDAKQGELGERIAPLHFVNYTCNFLSFIAGPVQRYGDYTLQQGRALALDEETVFQAFARLIKGFVKVGVVSAIFNYLFSSMSGRLLDPALAPALPLMCGLFVAAAVFYAVYLYANFSGYMDIVIGVDTLMGQELPENFNRPFTARSFLDFWSRWHMTLSDWFRTYVFNPLMKTLASRFTSPQAGPYLGVLAFFVTFLIMGVWHGTTSVFVVYGLLMGSGASINKLWQVFMTKRLGKKGYKALSERTAFIYLCRGLTVAYFALALTCLWVDMRELSWLAGRLGIVGIAACYLGLAVAAAAAFFAWDALMLPLGPIARVMTQRSGGVIVRNLSLASQILLIVTVASFFHKAPEFVYRAF